MGLTFNICDTNHFMISFTANSNVEAEEANYGAEQGNCKFAFLLSCKFLSMHYLHCRSVKPSDFTNGWLIWTICIMIFWWW